MMDYSGIEIKDLTLDDALNDAEWDKRPADISTFAAVDKPIMRGLRRLTDGEKAAFIDALCDYMLDGTIPAYDGLPTGVSIMLDTLIDAHERRINGEYLKQYKRYVNGKINGKKKA